MSTPTKHWLIQGSDGLKVFYETTIPISHISVKAVEEMLKRLASKHLTEDEIISCSIRKGRKGHTDLLRVHKEALKPAMCTTLNPHYSARVAEIEG